MVWDVSFWLLKISVGFFVVVQKTLFCWHLYFLDPRFLFHFDHYLYLKSARVSLIIDFSITLVALHWIYGTFGPWILTVLNMSVAIQCPFIGIISWHHVIVVILEWVWHSEISHFSVCAQGACSVICLQVRMQTKECQMKPCS